MTALLDYMADCRSLVLQELQRITPLAGAYRPILYDLVFTYPLRAAKALRPSLCVATCRALGGSLEGVLPSATVLELYHNAFLIHDDIEDGSETRRDGPTLHREHGIPIAVNVGDAMLALTIEPLIDNMRLLSLGKALRILRAIARMARESAEGQALELSWIRKVHWNAQDRDYFRLVHQKTSHYTFLAPVEIGGIVAGASASQRARLRLFATALGVAFQIQDDILNLEGDEGRVGKENAGDLWEGKHTLILLHARRRATRVERKHALEVLAKPRPVQRSETDRLLEARELVARLQASGDLSPAAGEALRTELERLDPSSRFKTDTDVAFLRDLIHRKGSIAHARDAARRRAVRARQGLTAMKAWLKPSVHADFLFGITQFVIDRDH